MSATSTADKQHYVNSLEQLIPARLDALEAAKPRVFEYKGLNLRSAIEKKLYFKTLNHEAMLQQFLELRASGVEFSLESFEEKGAWKYYSRHTARTIVSKTRAAKPTPWPGALPLLITHTAKHRGFGENILDGMEFNHRSTDHSEGKAADFDHALRNALPDTSLTSAWLFANHYDLLVECEALLAMLSEPSSAPIIVLEGNTSTDALISIIANHQKRASVCIQFGWSYTVHLAFQRMPHARFLCWGDAFAEALIPTNPTPVFEAVGHGLLEPVANEAKEVKTISVIMQAIFGLAGADAYNAFCDSLFVLLSEGWELLVREHPSHPMKAELKQRLVNAGATLVDPRKLPLSEQLTQSQVTYTLFSSVGFEAMASNNVAVFASYHMDIDLKPDLTKTPFAHLIKKPDELLPLLNDLKKTGLPRKDAKALEHYFFATGNAAKANLQARILGKN